MWGKILSIFM